MELDDIWEEVEACLDEDFPLGAVRDIELPPLDRRAVEPLVARLDDDDLRVVFAAGLVLAHVDAADTIVALLVPRFADPHPLVSEHLRWIVRELGDAALPALMDAYASQPKHQHAIAEALAFQGPRATRAAMVLREDARGDAAIAEALREIVGPWPTAPERPIPYLGEHVRMDGDGPPPLEAHGIDLWLDAVQWSASMDESATWNRAGTPEYEVKYWRPDRIAIAAPSIVLGAWYGDVVTATVDANDGARFTNQELLWKLRDTHHRIAPCNDRIFEGLKRQDDGSYYISTGS